MLIHSPKELAAFITYQRKQLKLSQAQVADLVGLKQKTISAFENKPEKTKLATLFLILSALNIDIHLSSKDKTNHTWQEEW